MAVRFPTPPGGYGGFEWRKYTILSILLKVDIPSLRTLSRGSHGHVADLGVPDVHHHGGRIGT